MSKGIFYTTVAPPRVSYVDVQTRRSHALRDGLFPRLSTDGRLLAVIDGQKIVVVKSDDPSSIILSRSVVGHPGWRAWKRNENVLAYSEELPTWKVKIRVLSISDNRESTVVEAARVKNLVWLEKEPNWPRLNID